MRLTRVQTGQVVIPPNDYGLVRRAKGRFVLVAVELKNVGDEPLRGLYDARLQVGDALYEQNSEATYTVTPLRAFPLAPRRRPRPRSSSTCRPRRPSARPAKASWPFPPSNAASRRSG